MNKKQEFAGKIAFALTEAVQIIPRVSSLHTVKINVNDEYCVTVKKTSMTPAEEGVQELLESMTGDGTEMVLEFDIKCSMNKKGG